MQYPTLDEVETADKALLGRWYRFLASPGGQWFENCDEAAFRAIIDKQEKILNRIVERFKQLGGWTPALSKAIGWGSPTHGSDEDY